MTALLPQPADTQPRSPARPRHAATRSLHRTRVKRTVIVAAMTALTIAVTGAAIGAHLAGQPGRGERLLLGWPGMQYVIYAVWMVPLFELAMLAAGQLHYRYQFRTAPAGKFSCMIIQITTTGREQQRVNQVISQIREYRLSMAHKIWVVTEPGQNDRYPLADVVLTVRADFAARSERKARALEYSRQIRAAQHLDRPDVKILFNDDDVAPTRDYIETAFQADYDVCEGITAPRTEYGVRPVGHFLASHADDLRTHACLVYCAVFQGIVGRPLHVHGEGLTVTGAAERAVTWDWPAFASEDLVFGRKAAKAGFSWGWFHQYAELTSPWNIRDFITQRRRWIWGDIHGIRHREVFSRGTAVMVAGKYLFGLVTMIFSLAGLYMRATGQLPGYSPIFDLAKLSVVAWLAVLFGCGWIGSGSRVAGRCHDSRLLSGLLAVLMLPASALLTVAGILVPLALGSPNTFQVIRKTREGSG